MTPSRTRIGVLRLGLGLGFAAVLLHLFVVMVLDHEVWAWRSHQNHWSFRSVPTQRGALLDRLGRDLAHDEPAVELSLHYRRFRQRHPVGAAVHAATALAEIRDGANGAVYDYRDGVLGPTAACAALLATPVRWFRPGALSKSQAFELQVPTVSLLAACSGLPRDRVFAAIRTAAQQDPELPLGAVLPGQPRERLEAAFASVLASLRELERSILEAAAARAARLGQPAPTTPLFEVLESRRQVAREELEQRRTKPSDKLLTEDLSLPFARHVPFELAVAMRTSPMPYPGIDVQPSLLRVRAPDLGPSLVGLLGQVQDLDRALPGAGWFDTYLARELPGDWVDDLVPSEGLEDAVRAQLKDAARRSYLGQLASLERRGVRGLEAAFDRELMGRTGVRLVEHDSRRREQHRWRQFDLAPGEDVVLSLDLDLQGHAEAAVRRARRKSAAAHSSADRADRVAAALVVIDARNGEVLAMAGDPVPEPDQADAAPVWQSWGDRNASLGSVVKPFLVLEQLQAEALGRPHRPSHEFEPCAGKFDFGGDRRGCAVAHGPAGHDPVEALAESCNSFFFRAALGFGEAAVDRALQRVGLLPGAPDEAPVTTAISGLWLARPRRDTSYLVPMRAIGYGVQATPAAVARAYAALATGFLPELTLRRGADRPRLPLAGFEEERAVVLAGLRACLQTGTGRDLLRLDGLQAFAKTGTAEVGLGGENNAWLAGFLPPPEGAGPQLCFAAVVYYVPDRTHGGEAAGQLVEDWLAAVQADPELAARYGLPEAPR